MISVNMGPLLSAMLNVPGAALQLAENGGITITLGAESYLITPLTIESGLRPATPQTMSPGKIASNSRAPFTEGAE